MTEVNGNEELSEKSCSACRAGAPQLTETELSDALQHLPEWSVVLVDDVNQLTRSYKFKNFVTALAFTNLVGAVADEYNHHPALLTEWGKVTVTWWTHKIKGLHENDVIMAAKTDKIFRSINPS